MNTKQSSWILYIIIFIVLFALGFRLYLFYTFHLTNIFFHS